MDPKLWRQMNSDAEDDDEDLDDRKYAVYFRERGRPDIVRKFRGPMFLNLGSLREELQKNEATKDLIPDGCAFPFGFLQKRRGRPKYYLCSDDDMADLYKEYRRAREEIALWCDIACSRGRAQE